MIANYNDYKNDRYLIDKFTLQIQGTQMTIDEINYEYINFMAMLNNPKSLNSTYSLPASGELTCPNGNNYQNMALCGGVMNHGNLRTSITKMNAIVPLPFSFTKSMGTALPLLLLDNSIIPMQLVINKKDKSY